MNNNKFIVLTVLIAIVIAMIGCAGGGSGSPAVVEKDVAGITATLNKFAVSLQKGTAATAGIFAQATDHTSTILYIQDFGKDINDPDDNETWYFSVNPADIVQPSSDIAYLKASRMLPDGTTLWLSFALVREQGIWLIETLNVIESAGATFVTASYFPVTPGASLSYSIIEDGVITSYITETGFAKTAMVKDGINFYQMLENFLYGNKKFAGRPSRRSLRAVYEFSSSYFGFDSHGQLCIYDPYINNGTPYVAFKTSYAFGAKDQFTEVYSLDGSTETTVTDVTIGFPQATFVTPLRTFSVVPVTLDFTVTSNSSTYNDKTVIYLAEGRGIVGYDYYDESNVLVAQERLLKSDINGVSESNDPVVSAPASSQSVVSGQNMVPVEFSVKGGSQPFSWGMSSSLGGIFLSPAGVLSGSPDPNAALGQYPVSVYVTDPYGRTDTFVFTLTLTQAPLSGNVTFSPPFSSTMGYPGRQEAWLMLDGSSFQYADYSIAATQIDPIGATSYINFFADTSGYAQVSVMSFQSGVTISFKVQITRNSDLAVFTSAVQTISVGPAASKR